MPDSWDWCDVAAVGVLTEAIAPRTSRAHRATFIERLLRQLTRTPDDTVAVIMAAEHRGIAAGIRYGYGEAHQEHVAALESIRRLNRIEWCFEDEEPPAGDDLLSEELLASLTEAKDDG